MQAYIILWHVKNDWFKRFFLSFNNKVIRLWCPVVSKPPLVLPVCCHAGAVTDVPSEQRLRRDAAQTGSALSPLLSLWHTPRNDKDPPGQRHDTHLKRHQHSINKIKDFYIICIIYMVKKNSQRVCVISLMDRLLRATEARKVCVLW